MNRKYALLSLFGLVLLTITLWSEVGLRSLIAQDEVWIMRSHMITGSQRVLAPVEWPTRPLRWIPHYTAHHLHTDSYLGYNVYLATLFLLRGVGVLIVLRKLLSNNLFMAFSATLLYLVYPIGEGWFSFRALTIQTATVLGLYAIYFLLVYWQRPHPWLWVLVSGLQVASLLTYEQYYAVFALVPLLLLWMQGSPTISRRFMRVSLLWYLTYTPAALRYLWIVRNGGTNDYMEDRIDILGSTSSLSLIPENLVEMYSLHLESWTRTGIVSHHLVLAAGMGIISFSLSSLIWRKYSVIPLSTSRWAILLAGAIGFMSVSFAHYSFFAHIVSKDFRIYFVPPLGAAVIISALIYCTASNVPRGRWLASGLLAILVSVGFMDARQQLHAEKVVANDVNNLLATVVETLPDLDQTRSTTTLLFIDEDDNFDRYGTAIRTSNLNFALQYLYQEDEDFSVYTCEQDRRFHSCEFHSDHILVKSRDGNTMMGYVGVVLFRVLPDGTVELLRQIPAAYLPDGANPAYDVGLLINSSASPPERAYSFFPCWPLDDCAP